MPIHIVLVQCGNTITCSANPPVISRVHASQARTPVYSLISPPVRVGRRSMAVYPASHQDITTITRHSHRFDQRIFQTHSQSYCNTHPANLPLHHPVQLPL